MLFTLINRDREGMLDLRMETRPAHVEFLNEAGGNVRFAGPILNDVAKPCGSLIILEADDLEAAKAWAVADPYAQAGLFEDQEILTIAQVIPDP